MKILFHQKNALIRGVFWVSFKAEFFESDLISGVEFNSMFEINFQFELNFQFRIIVQLRLLRYVVEWLWTRCTSQGSRSMR